MKPALLVICVALVVGAGTATPSVVGKETAAWTESKAERFVRSDATVRLAPEVRAALEAELRPAVTLYRLLAIEASLSGDVEASDAYYELWEMYSRALSKVRRGLTIDTADCTGSGAAAPGRRFSTFRCDVTSESLELPPAQLAENREPTVGAQLRNVGPIEAELEVRVTGKTSFAYRKV
jgi:hypothetical protein